MANSDMKANIEMEGQRLENGSWYTPFPAIGRSGHLVISWQGGEEV